jgi:hypothetical protein
MKEIQRRVYGGLPLHGYEAETLWEEKERLRLELERVLLVLRDCIEEYGAAPALRELEAFKAAVKATAEIEKLWPVCDWCGSPRDPR